MLDVVLKLMDLFDRRERSRFWALMIMVLVMGLTNMIGVAAIIPFLAVLGRPEVVTTNSILSWIYGTFGFSTMQGFLIALGVAVFVVYLFAVALRSATVYALFRFGAMRNYSLSVRLLEGYLHQPYAWFLTRHSAELSKSVLSEVSQVTNGVVLPLLNLIANLAVALGLLALLVLMNPLAALIMFAVMGIGYTAVFTVVRRRVKRMAAQRFTSNEVRFRVAQDTLSGVKEIKVRSLEHAAMRRFESPSRDFAEAVFTDNIVSELPRHLLEAIAFGGMMAIILVLLAVAGAEGESMTSILPVAGVYALAGARLAPSMQVVYRGFNNIRFNRPALEALHADFMATRRSCEPVVEDVPRLCEALELRDVRFTYPDAERPALDGLSLDIKANTTIGIVGGTGAGKTTAIDLLLGLISAQEGALVVDGREVRGDAARRGWRNKLGYVPQAIFLTDESVAANIAFGERPEDIDMKRVIQAARTAELDRFVMEDLPHGYETMVGDRGARLSGGQRQRIGIARALYHDPEVLILDEATSALDNLTERAVMASIATLGGAKTIIMVAHRLSTVRNCDEIFLLENGRLAARGRYDQLIEQNAAFRDMTRDIG